MYLVAYNNIYFISNIHHFVVHMKVWKYDYVIYMNWYS